MSPADANAAPPLRVVVIGYGHGGSVFHAPLIAATPGMQVAAIVTRAAQRQAQARREFPAARIIPSIEEMWSSASNYDLAVVTTPNKTHVPLGVRAVQAGLHVVVDKPLAASVADAQQLLAARARAGKILSVFQNARWANDFLTVRQLIAAGVLGRVVRMEARKERYRPAVRDGAWRERGEADEAGGLLYDLGSHLIDQALVLFGQPTSVYAEMEHVRPGSQVDDDTFIALGFAHGVHAHLWMSYVARRPGAALRISGLRGTYEKYDGDPQEQMLRDGLRPGMLGWGEEPRERWGHLSADVGGLHVDGPIETVRGQSERFYSELRDAIRTNGPPPVDPAEAVETLRVIEAAQHSARNKGMVVRAEV